MRLFVSVDLPDRLADPLADVQAAFADASGLTFTDPEQAHVTLTFLGEVDPTGVEGVERALATAVEEAGVDPFEATVGGLGAFPSLEYIRVVWVGFEDGGDELARLHDPIGDRLAALGFEDDHDFTAHVTLARMRHAGGKELVQRLVRERDPTVGTFTVDAVHLTESTLTDAGPRYETVTEFSL